MKMDVYVGLPRDMAANAPYSGLGDLPEVMGAVLKPFYGANTDTTIYLTDVPDTATVYIMGTPKYQGMENEIKNDIKDVLVRRYNTLKKIDIKLNYGALNPNFKPPLQQAPQLTSSGQRGDSAENSRKAVRKNDFQGTDEFNYEKLSQNYSAEEPRYSFDQVVLPQKTLNQIEEAIGVIEVEGKVFDEWGLRSIIPYAASALSFYGPPGTGKTMAAEAVAHRLKKKILSATYADIESKFHGEGPKMVKAIFMAAERDNAVLFLDESDSLLSKRLTNVSDGSAQAINSMRSQLLICLEHFKGVVIFATNLVVNYDKAFLSRLINIEFPMPNVEARAVIWNNHLKGSGIRIPLAADVDIGVLAANYEFCGRDIKNAVKSACVSAALQKRDLVDQEQLVKACNTTKEESEKAVSAKDFTKSQHAVLKPEEQSALKAALEKKIADTPSKEVNVE